MPIACIADTVHVYSVTKCLNEQRKAGHFCDVLLKVAGHTLPSHACVLSAVSPYFRRLIYGQRPNAPHLPTSDAPQEIDLSLPDQAAGLVPDNRYDSEGCGLEVVAGLLDYIYTGKISLREGTVHLVVKLAEAFALDGLLAVVRRYVDNNAARNASEKIVPEAEPLVAKPKPNRPKQVVTLSLCRDRKVLLPRSLPPPPLSSLRPLLPVRSPRTSRHLAVAAAKARLLMRARSGRHGVAAVAARKSVMAGLLEEEEESRRSKSHKKHKYWFSCTQCKFFSCDVKAVRDHKLVHPGKSYVCITCGFFTVQCSKLLEHMLNANHPETECSLCGTVCTDRATFRKHLERHDPRKPFLCNLCDFKCTSRSYLAAHTRKHTTERPFVCEVCSAAFKWKKSLQTHMLSHSKDKAFMCDQCDFRTAYKGTLKLHLRRHSGEMFKCPHEGCSCEAYSQQNLKKHMLTHNNEKPYVCEVCGQKYSQEQSLRRHLKVHEPGSGNRLHCRHCSFSTTRGYKLKEHARKVHHIDPPFGRSGVPYPPIAIERFGHAVDAAANQPPAPPPPPPPITDKIEQQPDQHHYRHEEEDPSIRDDLRPAARDDLHENMAAYMGLGLSLPMFTSYQPNM